MTQYTHPFKFPGKIFGHNSSRSLVAFISKFISRLHVGICRFLFIEYWRNTSPWIDSLGTDQKFSLSLDTEPGYFLYTQPNRLFHLQLVVGCSPSFTHSFIHSLFDASKFQLDQTKVTQCMRCEVDRMHAQNSSKLLQELLYSHRLWTLRQSLV